MPLIEPRFRMMFAALFGVFMIFGMSMTIIGATLPKILSSFGWSYFVAGLVLAANAVAYFSFTFVGGYLIKYIGAKLTILIGLAVIAVGMLFFAATPDPLTNILLGAFLGMGQGFVEISVNWATLRLDTAKSGRPMNLMHGAFAVGAIIGPLALAGLLATGFDWVTVYRCMSAVFALLAVVIVLLPMLLSTGEDAASPGDARISRHPAYWLSFLALFFYVGVELGVSNWVAEYFVSTLAYPAAKSGLLVSLFWAGLLAGRFGVPLLYHGQRQAVVLMSFSLLATLAIMGLSILSFLPAGDLTTEIGLGLVFLSGLGCSIFYPVVITLLGDVFPKAQSQAIAFAATGGGIGAFVFPFVMSALAQGWGLRVGFATYAVFGIAMTVAALGLALAARRR
ncbi:MAG: MFS transporter [Candidatus Saccharibacteria bacterium]|nr:MFS transporter [Pseudorhodobacter sp.]